MSFIIKCMLAPVALAYLLLSLACGLFLKEKLPKNPLYSATLYKSKKVAPSRGVYNFYVLSVVAFCLIAAAGGLGWAFCLFMAGSVLAAMLVDPAAWSQKLSPTEMPRQVWHYVGLLGQALKTELLVLLVATTLVYGVVKPYTRSFDVFSGYTLHVLYGLYLLIRTIVFCRYLFVVLFRWDTYHAPPFEIRKANFRSRNAALRHLLWSYFLGNVGLVVRCGYYSMIVGVLDRFYAAVGYPNLSGGWGLALVVATIVGWVVLADLRLTNPYYKAHRSLHENQALYASVHRIHHYAVYPTVLDSGTINPAEFLITESISIWFVPLPDWLWFAFQLVALGQHFIGHHTLAAGDDEGETYHQFHVLHHRLYQCNYGFPAMDEKYQTLVTWSELADSTEQEPTSATS